MVLGHSRLIWARFVLHQDLQTVLRCHMAAFEALGGAPREVLYDRMKTAVIGEGRRRRHRLQPRRCSIWPAITASIRAPAGPTGPRPRARSSGRSATSARTSSWPARFRNLDDLNAQLRHWLDTVANPRVHATTRRVVSEAFAEERPHLRPLPLAPFRAVLKLERRVSREGMVCVGGNLYSVPDATRRRVLEVHTLADEIRIFEDGALIAVHPVLEGRHQRRVAPGHRKHAAAASADGRDGESSCRRAPATRSRAPAGLLRCRRPASGARESRA